mmetsp:Transcript_34073/g.63595  ORF Transcript_34073/g.63595 Transcript_34073/m.63595 type:complete len:478 (-) Transcript_34073:157-1590(-)
MADVHQQLLHEIRQRSAAAQQAETDAKKLPPELSTWRNTLGMMQPLLLAAFRCMLIRNAFACVCGVTLLCRGCFSGQIWQLSLGLLLFALAIRGLPGGTPFLEVQTEAGFYAAADGCCASRNEQIRQSMQAWMRCFEPCPWQRSGEVCTMLPYITNTKRFGELKYERMWIEAEDGERFASDWVFPPTGFDASRPVVVLLTGLAPSQHWTQAAGFIADAAWYLTHRASMTVVVMVSRGTMDTHVNANMFHGARVTDLRKLLEAMTPCLENVSGGEKATIFAAGFSMGAIILANYCGHYGKDPLLAGGIHFSGVHDCAMNMKFQYSRDTWQAFLALSLKQTLMGGRMTEEARRRGVNIDHVMSSKVASVVDVDEEFVTIFNGYDGVLDYYRDVSVAAEDKWRSVSIPLLAVAARDDPITHCDALRAKEFSTANENLLFLITERGGHVGWPWGIFPWQHGWDFMNQAIEVFVDTALMSKK